MGVQANVETYFPGVSLPPVMDPLYYIQVKDIEPLHQNRLRLLIKGLGRKQLKISQGSKHLKAKQKDCKGISSCSRCQILRFRRIEKQRPKQKQQPKQKQRPKKKQQPEQWPPRRISESWLAKKMALEKLRENGNDRIPERPASEHKGWEVEEEALPEYKHSLTTAPYKQKLYETSLPQYESL